MASNAFFNESREQSRVKAEIIAKYFWAWSKVIIPTAKRGSGKLGYIDLFAGPGRYLDGTKSTPLLILEQAVHDSDMCEMLVTLFNDSTTEHTDSLKNEIDRIDGIKHLKHQPEISSSEVGESFVSEFERMNLIPCLSFLDPWGYKGLSCRLVNSVIKDWGCETVIFFNFNRINMGIRNGSVENHIVALFGQERFEILRDLLPDTKPFEREQIVLKAIIEALKEMGGKYILPFCFKGQFVNRTSHYIIFVSKNIKGYDIMKQIMGKMSSSHNQGVPSFIFDPRDRVQSSFDLSNPLDELEKSLLKHNKGRSIEVRAIFEGLESNLFMAIQQNVR